ncbi:MAG TPA: S1 family peptidase [Nocardioidaceae bacterium]|nr:S1 family peptidase [Nocardioidaceae bacterium]
MADAIRFRSELGFDARPEVVQAMVDRGEIDARGLVLTLAERQDLERRSAMRTKLEDALVYVGAHPESFGGAFFDQSVGDLLLVVRTLSHTPTRVLDELQSRLPTGAKVEFRLSEHSEAALITLRQDLAALGPDIVSSLAMDVVANRVEVATLQHQAAALQAAIAGRNDAVKFVDPVTAEGAACASRTACTVPWRGGTKTSADGLDCTLGSIARPTTSSTTKFMIEAGHCSRLNKNVSHNGSVINIAPGVDRNTYDQIGSQWTDVLSAPLKTDAGARNLIYINSVSTAYAITSIKTAASQAPGDSVCISAVTSGYRCGTIEVEGASLTYPRLSDGKSQTFTSLTRVSFNVVGGDSGGPVISGTLPQAFGIVSATAGGEGYYSPIDLALSEVSLRLCLNAACT